MNDGNGGSAPSAPEIARYIEQFAREMRTMAQKVNLPFLAFLLTMVADESAATLRRMGGPPDAP